MTTSRAQAAIVKLIASLAIAADQPGDARAAMETSLKLISKQGKWALGRLAVLAHEQRVPRTAFAVWHAPHRRKYKKFIEASRRTNYNVPGGQFLTRVVTEQRLVWLEDLSTASPFERREAALAAGLRSAFAFPVVVNGQVSAVLEFWDVRRRPLDAALVSAVSALAGQLARLVERKRAAVRASDLTDIIEATGVAIVTRDLEGTITSWNAGAERILGYTAAETVGKYIGFYHPADYNDRRVAHNEALAASRIVPAYPSCRIAKDGRSVDLLLSVAPLHDFNGSVTGAAVLMQDMSDLVRAQTAARRNESLYRTTFDHAAVAIAHVAPDGRWLRVNPELCRMLGYTEKELLALRFQDITHREDLAESVAFVEKVMRGDVDSCSFEKQYVRKDGTIVWGYVNSALVRDASGMPDYFVTVIKDVTARVKAEAALRAEREQLELIADNVPAMIAYCDPSLRYLYANKGYRDFFNEGRDLTGLNLKDVVGKSAWREICDHVERAADGESVTYQRTALAPDGSPKQLSVTLLPRRANNGGITGVHAFVVDVTESARHEQELRYNANHDALTRLPNRALLNDRLTQTLAVCQRSDARAAVLYVDIDRFKRVNDSLGHQVGDKLIATLGERLSQSVRAADTVARVGGDEFVFLLPDLKSEDDAAVVGEKVRRAVAEPVVVAGHELRVSASVGVAVYPKDGSDGATLLRNADTALYRAKDHGRDCMCFFAPEMNHRVVTQLQLENDLRVAIERNQFYLEYQPIVILPRGRVVGAEALVRWKKSDGTRVSPAEFIPLAEETGLIVELGHWVLREAAREAARWTIMADAPLFVSVNLSPKQFRDPALPDKVRAALAEAGLDPTRLKLEITESTVMQDAENAILMLRALKALGVTLSVDDFGTGYSSLSYLKRFPLDTLKIDRSFVRDLAANEEDRVICRSVINLAHALGLRVVAEGIEATVQASMLAADGCDFAQGFHFSKPLSSEDFWRLIARNTAAVAVAA